MPENTDSRGGVVNCPALLLSESLRAQLKVYGLSLAPGTTVCGEVAFESPVSVFSGSHVAFSSLGAYSYVSFGSKLVHASVGRYTSIAHQVEVGLSQHDIRAVSTSAALINAGVFDFCSGHVERLPLRLRQGLNMENTVHIGHDVWIGAHALFPSEVNVGTGAIVGSGAVVTKDVPPYAIVGGNPARLIRYRFSQKQIADLLESRWWEFDLPEAMAQGLDIPLDNADEFLLWWHKAPRRDKLMRLENRRYVLSAVSSTQCTLRKLGGKSLILEMLLNSAGHVFVNTRPLNRLSAFLSSGRALLFYRHGILRFTKL